MLPERPLLAEAWPGSDHVSEMWDWRSAVNVLGIHSYACSQGDRTKDRERVTGPTVSAISSYPKIRGLTWRLHSCSRNQAGFMLHVMGARLSHNSPTRMAEGPE